MESSKRPSQKRPAGETASEHGCHPKQPKSPKNVSFKRNRFGVSEMVMKAWDRYMKSWFPHLFTCIYFVPCLYMNTVNETPEKVAGLEVSILQSPVEDLPGGSASSAVQVSMVRTEQTQHRILYCLNKFLGKIQDAIVFITNLDFKDFLANAPNTNLPKRQKGGKSGDFDMLIIHRRYGLIVSEIKTVGDIFDTPEETQQQAAHREDIVRKRIEKALKQLTKGQTMLTHFLSDLSSSAPRISCVLMLPNIPRKMLREIVNNCSAVCNAMSRCFGNSLRQCDLCLCADDLSKVRTPYDITESSHTNLSRWWEQTIAGLGEDPNMTDNIYEELVFRFAGPPTNICKWNIHTIDEALSVTGDTFSSLRLTSEQLQAVKCPDQLVYLSGPPGTGKTQALFLKGKEWCDSGKEVHLLCTWSAGLAAAHYIKHMIEMRSRDKKGERLRIHIQRFNLSEAGQLENAVECLSRAAVPDTEGTDQELYIIADEAFAGSKFDALCDQLQARIGRLHMWAASVYHGHRPGCMTECTFTLPLRTPPTVTEEVKKSEYFGDFVKNYSEQSAHSPQPPVYGKSLEYVSHRGPGHYIGGEPADCQMCGIELTWILKGLNVGGKCLKFSDVLLLTVVTSFNGFIEERRDWEGNVEQPASGLVQALRAAGVPVRIVKADDEAAIGDVAKMEGPDAVIAANAETIRGLERKLVVWVQADREDEDSDEISFGRLDAMSRATAHVIVVS